MPHIQDIHDRGKLAVLVGGTMYYMQALLWEGALLDEASPAAGHSGMSSVKQMEMSAEDQRVRAALAMPARSTQPSARCRPCRAACMPGCGRWTLRPRRPFIRTTFGG